MSTPDDPLEQALQDAIILLFRADALIARWEMGIMAYRERAKDYDYLNYFIKKEGSD